MILRLELTGNFKLSPRKLIGHRLHSDLGLERRVVSYAHRFTSQYCGFSVVCTVYREVIVSVAK